MHVLFIFLIRKRYNRNGNIDSIFSSLTGSRILSVRRPLSSISAPLTSFAAISRASFIVSRLNLAEEHPLRLFVSFQFALMAEEASPNTIHLSMKLSLCDECKLITWKYRCPGCSIRSCSLPCVNLHKKRTNCTGKRRHTELVPLSQFDDSLLLADYMFLEETKRVADSARRMISGFHSYYGFRIPNNLRTLQNAARRRKTKLLFLPAWMSKRETNQSIYDQRKNTIFWTLELRFHGTNIVLFHHGVDEHACLLPILAEYLTPGPWNHKLKSFCDVQLDDLKLFLQKNQKGLKPQFRTLSINTPLGSQLANIVILEHPTILIYLPSHKVNFEVEAVRVPLIKNTVTSNFVGKLNRNGTSFRVEEFVDEMIPSDTRITDLNSCSKAATECIEVSDPNALPSNNVLPNSTIIADKLTPEPITLNTPESINSEFYFEQELRDAYSDLIGEMNPDDFLCFDGVYDATEDLLNAQWYATEGREDAIRDEFDGREWVDLGEIRGNEELNGKPVTEMEERLGKEVKERRASYLEEKREHSFLSSGLSFGEIELEEGEIPCFL